MPNRRNRAILASTVGTTLLLAATAEQTTPWVVAPGVQLDNLMRDGRGYLELGIEATEQTQGEAMARLGQDPVIGQRFNTYGQARTGAQIRYADIDFITPVGDTQGNTGRYTVGMLVDRVAGGVVSDAIPFAPPYLIVTPPLQTYFQANPRFRQQVDKRLGTQNKHFLTQHEIPFTCLKSAYRRSE